MVLRATLGNTTVPRTVYTVWRTRALRRCLVCVKGRSLATRTVKHKGGKDETGSEGTKEGGTRQTIDEGSQEQVDDEENERGQVGGHQATQPGGPVQNRLDFAPHLRVGHLEGERGGSVSNEAAISEKRTEGTTHGRHTGGQRHRRAVEEHKEEKGGAPEKLEGPRMEASHVHVAPLRVGLRLCF